jgi:hypothetical protein
MGVKTKRTPPSATSSSFIAQHPQSVTGVLHCWDRLRFMGSIPTLQRPYGMLGYLHQRGVLLKDFREWSEKLTERVRRHGQDLAAAAGRAVHYLQSSTGGKEEIVRGVIERERVKEGLVGVWSVVEP